jgi:hypothetical protein
MMVDFGIFSVRYDGKVEVRLGKGGFILPVTCTGHFVRPEEVEVSPVEHGIFYVSYYDLRKPYLFLAGVSSDYVKRTFLVLVEVEENSAGIVANSKIIPVSLSSGAELMFHAIEYGKDAVRLLLYHYNQPVVDEREIKTIEKL